MFLLCSESMGGGVLMKVKPQLKKDVRQESIRFHAHVTPQARLYVQPFPPRLFTVGSCLELFTEFPPISFQ